MTDAASAQTQPAVSSESNLDTLVGQTISDRYLLLERLGDGAMGVVYLAEHTLMHKRVAVKVLHPEMSRVPEIVARFEREAVAAGHIEHPNVAAASDFGKLTDGTFFLVLEYIEGTLLRKAISRGRLATKDALHIANQVAQGLVRAHSLGIIHRDLKPENIILIERDGDPYFVKILDFGIARVPMGELAKGENGVAVTQAGMVYGTPEYMAPEQALGEEISAQADLYALGVMLFEMLTGWRPFDADSKVQLLGMHVTAPVPSLREKAPDVFFAEPIEKLVRDLMEKDARKRPADAKEVLARLRAIEDAGLLLTSPPPPMATAPSRADSAEVTLPFLGEARVRPQKTTGAKTERSPVTLALAVLGATLFATLFVIVVRRALAGSQPDDDKGAAKITSTAAAAATATGSLESQTPNANASAEPLEALTAPEEKLLRALRETPSAAHADQVYDAWISGTLSPEGIKQAKTLLVSEPVRAQITPALQIALDLRAAGPTCAVKSLLGRAGEQGDARALPYLRVMLKPKYVKMAGHHQPQNVYGCVNYLGEPRKTIEKIEKRLR